MDFRVTLLPDAAQPGAHPRQQGRGRAALMLAISAREAMRDAVAARDGVVPRTSSRPRSRTSRACQGLKPPRGVVPRHRHRPRARARRQLYVLEDNLRCPSGVSYVLENRR
jgi:uncharacterized circularly permuted ATP-grasp superfamily protein